MADRFNQGYALLIGINENAVPGWALPDVAKDVVALREVLVHPERCAYPDDHVKVLQGQEATRDGILGALQWLKKQIQADKSGNATAVVYYSGHGWRDMEAQPPAYYLIPCNMNEDAIALSALRVEDFATTISTLQPRRLLVVLDCCHAGGMDVKNLESVATGYISTAIPAQLLMGKDKGISTSEGTKGLEQLAQGAGRRYRGAGVRRDELCLAQGAAECLVRVWSTASARLSHDQHLPGGPAPGWQRDIQR